MTKIMFIKNNLGYYNKIEVSGHTGYADSGSDILCSAISSIVQSGALGLVKVLKIKANIKRNDKKGYFLVELPNNMSLNLQEKSQIIFETMYVSLEDLYKGYSKYIQLEVK